MRNIIAVVVTYNRLKLLTEALAAIKNQTLPPDKIIVINNGSSDGTTEFLEKHEGIICVNNRENLGASSGFYNGIKHATNNNADWIWVMDDDAICLPDALEQLVTNLPLINKKVGFVGSRCNWIDGEPHLMSVPDLKPYFNKKIPFNTYDQYNLILTETTSWVSLLINAEVVKEIGLPYKEFFFWSDDLEYTRRITKAGYLGFYSSKSVVLHKSAVNYTPDFFHDSANNVWKYSYGYRNEFFLKKKDRGFLYFLFWLVAKVGYISFKTIKIRRDSRLKFIGVLFRSAWSSIFFNPSIDPVR